jgi:hypothetical protein
MSSNRKKFLLLVMVALAALLGSRGQSTAATLKPGDIICTDSGNAVEGGFLLQVNPRTGKQTVISAGGLLQSPFGVVVEPTGMIIVSDSGRLILINPADGRQSVLADHSTKSLGYPYGIDIDSRGQILVANAEQLVCFDPISDRTVVVSAGQNLLYPMGVAVAEGNHVFVANVSFPSQILRINPKNGIQKVLTRGGYLKVPQAITCRGDKIYVTDVATPDGNFGIGRVVQIDARTGAQRVVTEGGFLVGPVGIDVGEDGHIFVADPYTINPASPDAFDGGIIRIDPASGRQELIARGHGSFVNPRGITVVGRKQPEWRPSPLIGSPRRPSARP